MRLDVLAPNVPLSPALVSGAEKRFRAATSRFVGRVEHVTIRISDENGPKGGVDKRCRVEVSVMRRGTFVVEENDADAYKAIGRAAKKVKQILGKQLGKPRSFFGFGLRKAVRAEGL